ncbi:nucleotidyltransferase domain-containing protein [Tissierellaceae bacterium HCP3S3_D8]
MKEIIIGKLKKIEEKEQVKILFAVESGSRAWRFPSIDSDYDVRFVYIHPIEWYLSIDEGRDVLEYPINDLLDISGWDIRKALRLFKKSNPSIMEWISSPIRYFEYSSFLKQISGLSNEYFSPKSSMYHYIHIATSNYRKYLQGDMVKIKEYFYVLRSILACKWIEINKTIPPIDFEDLLESQVDDKELSNEIKILLERKKSGEELDIEPRIEVISKFLEDEIMYYQSYVKRLDNGKKLDVSILDSLFLKTLKEVWG